MNPPGARALALVPALLGVLACSELPAALERLDGTFSYLASDSAGTPLLSGVLRLDVRRDSTISGTWEIGWIPGADQAAQVGPQVGAGSLTGAVERTAVFLDLNPEFQDNNVILYGRLEGGWLIGAWSYSGIGGPIARGRFVARR